MSLKGNTLYFNESLEEWSNAIHILLSNCYGTNRTLGRYAKSMHMEIISSVLVSITKEDILGSMRGALDIDKYISICHSAWSRHYITWKNTNYTRSSIARDAMATTWVTLLDPDQSQIYADIVEFIFSRLSNYVLENGMKDLCI